MDDFRLQATLLRFRSSHSRVEGYAMSSLSSSAVSARALRGAALGGLAAGTLDILYAFAMAGMSGRTPLRVLQSVASGLLGREAFEGGIAAGTIGLLCHFAITLGAAAVFLLAYARVPIVRERWILAAVVFGALVYAFMHVLVLPLSAIPFRMSYSPS